LRQSENEVVTAGTEDDPLVPAGSAEPGASESGARSTTGTLRRIVRDRALLTIPTMLIVIFMAMALVDVMPGDPAATIAGPEAQPEQIKLLRTELGLDRPFLERFWDQIENTVTGHLGRSLVTGRDVTDMIGQSAGPTVSIAIVALLITAIVGVSAGTLAALKRGTRIDAIVNGFAALALSIPVFVIALFLIMIFAVNYGWFPATGYRSIPDAGFFGWLTSVTMPAVALALNSTAELTRQVRGALVDVLEQDYIRTSRAAGLSRAAVIGRHALRNAAVPVITVFGLQIGRILGGAVVVEQVFAVPGFGSMTLQAVQQRDIPVIQGAILVSGAAVLAVNLITDLVQPLVNPKLRGS
jgi:peptide/nickel transport system permease protein